MILDLPPHLILPDHFEAARPAIIRPGVDLASYFPAEIDRRARRAIIRELVSRGVAGERGEARKLVEAMIPFGMFAAGSSGLAATYLDNDAANPSSATWVSKSMSWGTTGKLVALIYTNSGNITSVSLGGGTVVRTNVGTSDVRLYVCVIQDVTGISGTMSVTCSSTASRIAVALYSISGSFLSTSPSDTASATTANPTQSIDVAAGGIIFGVAHPGNASATLTGWSGATSDFSADTNPGGSLRPWSGAHYNAVAAETNRSVGVTWSTTNSTNRITYLVAFR